jgi:O-antigen/teichoic acid export membrane protein
VKDLFSSIYLLSRIASAVLNLVAIAIFTRLSSQEVYGQYLISFAYGFIVYSLAIQWLISAHFGQQSRQDAGRIATTVVVLAVLSVTLGASLIGLAVAGNFISGTTGFGCAVVLLGLAVYFVASEIGRSQLLVIPVTTAAFLRSGLTLVLGSFALWMFHSAPSLLLAVAVAHILASLPILMALRRSIWRKGFEWPSRASYQQIWLYSWPLILAGGGASVAASVDRIVLERFFGPAEIASYGVILDFIKQSFIIVGESVAISYVSMAKAGHGDGEEEKTKEMLAKAFVTISFLATFGVMFFLLLGKPLFQLLLGKAYLGAMGIIPWLAVANACLILRSYYFAQVIYFTKSARLELISTVVALVISVGLSSWLIPLFAVTGAAAAFTLAQIGALLSILLASSTRQTMPVDFARLSIVVLLAGATLAAGVLIRSALPEGVAAALNLALMITVAGILLVRWDLFDAGIIWRRFSRTLFP